MAEIVIPMAILGGLYIVSNQDDKNKKVKETFVDGGPTSIKERSTMLSNANVPSRNFPINGRSELKETPEYYQTNQEATNSYLQKIKYKKNVLENEKLEGRSELQYEDKNPEHQYSLTGEKIEKENFKHNNMVPFFGSRVTQNTVDHTRESYLDNTNGSGSIFIKKQETAPFFKPQKNLEWAHGTPNASSFLQSRMNPSTSLHNVKPFQEVRVGPGLNQKEGVLGSGGFNSGMESRHRWMPRNVDELRVKNNPKITYGGVILGGKDKVTNRGVLGTVEKNRPDTYYINSPERYFTTTGQRKAQTHRSEQIVPTENRETTTREYFGQGEQSTGEAPYVKGIYRDTHRRQLDPCGKQNIRNAHAAERFNSTTGDYGVQSYKSSVLPNNRTLDSNQSPNVGVVSTYAKALVAPLLDILRPTRKQNVIGNIRPQGNVGNSKYSKTYVYNPADRAKTTIREMTENKLEHNFVNNQQEAGGYGYVVNEKQPVAQNRDTTSCHYVANPNQSEYANGYGYVVNEKQPVPQNRDTTSSKYIGNAGNTGTTSNARVYDMAYNAHLIDKSVISKGRKPMGDSVKVFNPYQNIKIDKLEQDRHNHRMFVPQYISKMPSSVDNHGRQDVKPRTGQDIVIERNAPDILNAFKRNPYTQPLDSIA